MAVARQPHFCVMNYSIFIAPEILLPDVDMDNIGPAPDPLLLRAEIDALKARQQAVEDLQTEDNPVHTQDTTLHPDRMQSQG